MICSTCGNEIEHDDQTATGRDGISHRRCAKVGVFLLKLAIYGIAYSVGWLMGVHPLKTLAISLIVIIGTSVRVPESEAP